MHMSLGTGWQDRFHTPDTSLDYELARTSTLRLRTLADEIDSFLLYERDKGRLLRSVLYGLEVDLFFRDEDAASDFLDLVKNKCSAIVALRSEASAQ